MRAAVLEDRFGLDHLQLRELAEEPLGPGQVRVRLKAASLNYRDLLMVKGHYDPRQALPLVPGSDGAGEVMELGADVAGWSVGDRVIPAFMQSWQQGPVPRTREALRQTLGGPLDGTLAERRVFPADALVRAPDHLDDFEAAALPCAAVTAWRALVTHGQIRAGDVVVLQGTGGVSMAALQIAVCSGAKVIVTSSSDEKLERAKALGASELINYRSTPDWGKEVLRRTAGAGADHVVEVGGAGTLEQSLKAIRPGGHISLIGVLAGTGGPINLLPVLMRDVRVQGVLVGSRTELEEVARMYATHGLRPVMDRRFALSEVREAFAHLESGKHFGKLGISLSD